MGKVPYVEGSSVAGWLLTEQNRVPITSKSRLRAAQQLLQPRRRNKTLVVDVRDVDFSGGNIKGAVNLAYFDDKMATELVDHCIDNCFNQVVFHCLYSRFRGPKAALLFTKKVAERKPTIPIEIHVLQGGWSKWKKDYRHDDRLVENMDDSKVVLTPDDREFTATDD